MVVLGMVSMGCVQTSELQDARRLTQLVQRVEEPSQLEVVNEAMVVPFVIGVLIDQLVTVAEEGDSSHRELDESVGG